MSGKNSNISKNNNNSFNKRESEILPKNAEYHAEMLEFQNLKELWSDLGVTENFRNFFENIALELDLNVRKEYIDFEITSLKKLKDQIQVKIKFLF